MGPRNAPPGALLAFGCPPGFRTPISRSRISCPTVRRVGNDGVQSVLRRRLLAEEQGFEPWRPFGPPAFKTGAFDHSATLPKAQSFRCAKVIIKESPARARSAVPTTLPGLPSAMPILTAAKPFSHAAVHPGWHSRSGFCRSSPEQPSRAPYSPPDFH